MNEPERTEHLVSNPMSTRKNTLLKPHLISPFSIESSGGSVGIWVAPANATLPFCRFLPRRFFPLPVAHSSQEAEVRTGQRQEKERSMPLICVLFIRDDALRSPIVAALQRCYWSFLSSLQVAAAHQMDRLRAKAQHEE